MNGDFLSTSMVHLNDKLNMKMGVPEAFAVWEGMPLGAGDSVAL